MFSMYFVFKKVFHFASFCEFNFRSMSVFVAWGAFRRCDFCCTFACNFCWCDFCHCNALLRLKWKLVRQKLHATLRWALLLSLLLQKKKIAANVVKIKVCVKCLSFPLPQTFQINKYFAFWQKLKIIINDIKIKKLFKNIY